jgi:hypothetical protein
MIRPLLAALLRTTPAFSQVIPTGTPAADILLSRAITEYRTYLTCSALDPATHAQILASWQADVAAATAILTARNVPPEAITAFTAAADPKALMPAPDTPFSDVVELCTSGPDWKTAYTTGDHTVLATTLPQAFP